MSKTPRGKSSRRKRPARRQAAPRFLGFFCARLSCRAATRSVTLLRAGLGGGAWRFCAHLNSTVRNLALKPPGAPLCYPAARPSESWRTERRWGPLPDSGLHVGRSRTTRVLYAVRAFMDNNDPKPSVALIKKSLKIYPYTPGGFGTSIATALEGKTRLEANPPVPPTKFIEASGKSFNTIPPNDFSYFEMINELVQQEPPTSADPVLMGQLAAIGIVHGKPFSPDARMRKILTEAQPWAIPPGAAELAFRRLSRQRISGRSLFATTRPARCWRRRSATRGQGARATRHRPPSQTRTAPRRFTSLRRSPAMSQRAIGYRLCRARAGSQSCVSTDLLNRSSPRNGVRAR